MPTKKCIDCNEEKDLEAFYKKISDKTGLSSQCKVCCKIQREKSKAEKSCVHCLQTKLGQDFLGDDDHCRDCVAGFLLDDKKKMLCVQNY